MNKFSFRHIFASFALIFVALAVYAQDNDRVLNRPYADQKRIHFGFNVGMIFHDLNLTGNGFVTESGEQWVGTVPNHSPGFSVGVLADLRLATHFNLRFSPGMHFGNKIIHYRNIADENSEVETQNVKSTYVVLPIDLKISASRWRNMRPYFTTGVMGVIDVSKSRNEQLKFGTADCMLTVGLGCDIYLPFFKLCPELKFCFGLANLLKKDRPDLVDNPEMMKYTNSFSKVTQNAVVLSFFFE